MYQALQSGSYPAGNHWEAGEVRALDVAKDADLPSWLVAVKEPKKKASKKAESGSDVG